MSGILFNSLKEEKCVTNIMSTNIKCFTASKDPLPIISEVMTVIKIEAFTRKFPVLVAPELSCNLLLGADFMAHTRLILDVGQQKISFKFAPNCVIPLLKPQDTIINTIVDKVVIIIVMSSVSNM